METLIAIFGEDKQLSTLQMCDRGIAVFIVSLILIRISGRRSFGLRMPLDNIIAILLGDILSRAVFGASPFFPVVIISLAIVLMHRFCGWLISRNYKWIKWIEGDQI